MVVLAAYCLKHRLTCEWFHVRDKTTPRNVVCCSAATGSLYGRRGLLLLAVLCAVAANHSADQQSLWTYTMVDPA